MVLQDELHIFYFSVEVLTLYGLNKHVCTKQQALQLLEAETVRDSEPQDGNLNSTDKVSAEQESPLAAAASATRKSIFDDVLNYSSKPLPEKGEERTLLEEIDDYIKEPNLQSSSSELVYWRRNQRKFSKLSSLAKKYLSVPASSGGVERLFSIAGSIARARRNRITAQTLETILVYREWRIRKSSD